MNGHSSNGDMPSEFDFLILGGGTAGLALAARLTENPDVTVGVFEAGKNRLGDPLVDVPALFTQMLGNPEYDWNMSSEPQKGNKGKVHHMPRGKLLGGSSGINYMMYVRGSDADYDDWADLADDPSWSSTAMKQYMRKHQTLEPIDPGVTDRSTMPFVGENHGTSGPVRTSFNDTFLPIEADIIKACDEVAGLTKKPLDPWSGDHIGFFNTLGSVARSGPNRSRRSYAARGYYEPNAHRPNLHVYCEATVLRIVLEGDTAVGAEVNYNGHRQVFEAKREVLLCGGAIHSPQLLELSGIGNKDILSAADVECKIDLPGVGENFQDHVLYAVAYELQPGNFSLDGIYQPEAMEAAQKALVEQGGGPLTCISSAQGFLPYKSLVSAEELQETVKSIEATEATTPFQRKQLDKVIEHLKSDKSANLQVIVIPATVNADAIADQSKAWPPPKPDQPMGVTLAMCLQYPASRGSVHIKSSDVSQQPAIDPAYNTHPADVAVLAAGVTFLDKVAQSSHLASKLAKRVHPTASIDLSTTAGAKPVVEDWCFGEYHVAGTCAMGDVVDGRLRVKGVKALRVVDASVFANHVSGNICSSVYAVAEKAADMIKEDWDYAALAQVKGKTID